MVHNVNVQLWQQKTGYPSAIVTVAPDNEPEKLHIVGVGNVRDCLALRNELRRDLSKAAELWERIEVKWNQ